MLNFCPWTMGWSLAALPARFLPHIAHAFDVSIHFRQKKKTIKSLTIPLISAPLTELLALFSFHFAVVTGRSVSRVRILGLCAEKLALQIELVNTTQI